MAGKYELKFTLQAEAHNRRLCPVHVPLDGAEKPEDLRLYELQADGAEGREVPCQGYFCPARERAVVCFILDSLDAGQQREYGLRREGSPQERRIHLAKVKGAVEFHVSGSLFTAYHFQDVPARPYLYPLIGPWGLQLTECGPRDHVHHRSVYVAHGDVNGTDNWSEMKGHGRTEHEGFKGLVEGGNTVAALGANGWWVTDKGEKLLREELTVTAYALPETERALDFDVKLRATEKDLVFGDTKEGGILAVRVNEVMKEQKGGLIENSYGGVTEKENWGKRAQWCDYSGVIEGRKVGITIFDHPGNVRHPVYWHVRAYGLMTANPFGISAFTGDPSQRGDLALAKGETLWFRYRLYLHAGGAGESKARDKYHDFANPPKIVVSGR